MVNEAWLRLLFAAAVFCVRVEGLGLAADGQLLSRPPPAPAKPPGKGLPAGKRAKATKAPAAAAKPEKPAPKAGFAAARRTDAAVSSWDLAVSRASWPCSFGPLTPWCDKELLGKVKESLDYRSEKLKALTRKDARVAEAAEKLAMAKAVANASFAFMNKCNDNKHDLLGLHRQMELAALDAKSAGKILISEAVTSRQINRAMKAADKDVELENKIKRRGWKCRVRKLEREQDRKRDDKEASEEALTRAKFMYKKAKVSARVAQEKYSIVKHEIQRLKLECREAKKANAKAEARVHVMEQQLDRVQNEALMPEKVLMPTDPRRLSEVRLVLEKVHDLPAAAQNIVAKEMEAAREAAAKAIAANAKAKCAKRKLEKARAEARAAKISKALARKRKVEQANAVLKATK